MILYINMNSVFLYIQQLDSNVSNSFVGLILIEKHLAKCTKVEAGSIEKDARDAVSLRTIRII